MLPDLLVVATASLEAVHLLKCASGRVPLLSEGASAIHSAEVSLQLFAEQVKVLEKLLAVRVESVTLTGVAGPAPDDRCSDLVTGPDGEAHRLDRRWPGSAPTKVQ